MAGFPRALAPLVYDVKSYGAKGNGVTDDTAAIQAAITACAAAGGGIVFLPPGTYLLDSALSTSGQNVHVRGAGWSAPVAGLTNPVSLGTPLSVLKPSSSFPANTYVFTNNNTAYMSNGGSFTNIAINGNAAKSTSGVGGVHLGNTAFYYLDHVIMVDLSGTCVLTDEAAATYSVPSTSQIIYQNLFFQSCLANGLEFGSGIFSTEFFINNFWMDVAGDGIKFDGGTEASSVHIYDGNIQGATNGLYLDGIYEILVHDVLIYGAYNNGIYVSQLASYGYNSIVHDCICRDCDKNANGSAGIYIVSGTYDYQFHHNICEGVNTTPQNGILMQDAYGTNNVFVDATNYAVGNTNNYSIGGNIFATHPVGSVTVAVPASGTAVTAAPYDRTFYATAGTDAVTLAIENGPTVKVPANAMGTVRVPAGKTLTPTYTATHPPTWVVEGE